LAKKKGPRKSPTFIAYDCHHYQLGGDSDGRDNQSRDKVCKINNSKVARNLLNKKKKKDFSQKKPQLSSPMAVPELHTPCFLKKKN
jgi:hypothetical protein